MTQPLYAAIRPSSKYADQQPPEKFFEVVVGTGPLDDYIVSGNNNQYRIADLRFYIKAGERFVPLGR